jgi:hypothetical protein
VNREQWLETAVKKLKPILAQAGLGLPEVRVSCGFPSKGAFASRKQRIGECWHKDGIKQEKSHIFISPVLGKQVAVLETLIHELIHAALPPKAGHSKTFAAAAEKCGLEGKPTATHAGKELVDRLNDLFASMPYPHDPINYAKLMKKQTTRLRLFVCECGIKVRVARDEFHATCDECQEPFRSPEE